MNDFSVLTDAQLAAFAVEHQSELDEEDMTLQEVLAKLEAGTAVIERRTYGFAFIQLRPLDNGSDVAHLWILYVDHSLRGRGHGRAFMREIQAKYARDYHMSLHCVGPRRRAFFGKCGFRVESRDGAVRRMTTNESPHGIAITR